VVIVLLLFAYRSPVLWMLPVFWAITGLMAAQAIVYALARYADLTVNGQSQSILAVLVIGASVDYALLLVARYREELRRHEDRHEAMAFALHRAAPAILASAATVVVGLLCLMFADLNSTQGLGPIGAAGIFSAFAAMVTLLPAVLLIGGRRVFWPFVPEYGSEIGEPNGIWTKIGRFVSRRPRPVCVGTAIVLVVLSLGFIGADTHLAQDEQFRHEPESITGQQLLSASYAAGAGAPTTVIAQAAAANEVETAIASTDGVVAVEQSGDGTQEVAEKVARTGFGGDVEFDLAQLHPQPQQIEIERAEGEIKDRTDFLFWRFLAHVVPSGGSTGLQVKPGRREGRCDRR
jgi:RND superfamily putative drug exporter